MDARTSTLAPPSAINPPCEIVRNPDGSFKVITRNDVIASWDRETVKSFGESVTVSGQAFRNRWAFVDISILTGQMLKLTQERKLQRPAEILKPLIKKHIANRKGEAEILLEGYDIDGINEIREGDAIVGFSLPVKRSGEIAYKLVYSLKGGDTAIPMSNGTTVYVTVATAGEGQDIDALAEQIRNTWHDLANVIGCLTQYAGVVQYFNPDSENIGIANRTIEILEQFKSIHERIKDAVGNGDKGNLKTDVESFMSYAKEFQSLIESKQIQLLIEESIRTDRGKTYKLGEAEKETRIFEMASKAVSLMLTELMGTPEPKQQNISIPQLLDLAIFAELSDFARDRVRKTIEADTFSVTGYESRLFRIFVNLLKNAMEATQGNAILEISVFKEKDEIVVRIADNGPGIPKEKVDAFNARLPVESSKGKSGGRGLSIVRSMVKDHGGTIETDSLTVEEYKALRALFTTGDGIENPIGKESTAFFKAHHAVIDARFAELQEITETLQKNLTRAMGKEQLADMTKRLVDNNLKIVLRDTDFMTLFWPHKFSYVSWYGHIEGQIAQNLLINIDDIQFAGGKLKKADANKMRQLLSARMNEILGYREFLKRIVEDRRITQGTAFTIRLPVANLKSGEYGHEFRSRIKKQQLRGTFEFARNLTSTTRFYDDTLQLLYNAVLTYYGDTPKNRLSWFVGIMAEKVDAGLISKKQRKAVLSKFRRLLVEIYEDENFARLYNEATSGNKEALNRLVLYVLSCRERYFSLIDKFRKEVADTIPNERFPQDILTFFRNQTTDFFEELQSKAIEARILDNASTGVASASEQVYRDRLADTLKVIQAKQTQPLIIALGTSWIKGYEQGRYLQYDALNPLIANMRSYCEEKGIPFIVDDDANLVGRINEAQKTNPNAKVVVLTGEATAKSEDFALLRSNANAFIVGVNNQELTVDSYVRLMEMLTMALKLSVGLEVTQDSTVITIKKDDTYKIYIFIPHAEPMDYERLKHTYEVQKFA
jgi:signal transduction histidine kinase